MSADVILLNKNYQFHAIIGKKKALQLLFRGKCEIVIPSEEKITNAEKTVSFVIPKVLRLLVMVKSIFKNEMPFTKRNVFVRDEYTCQYCGKTNQKKSKDSTIDHVLPRSKGGRDGFANCVTACRICNESKGDRTPEQAGMKLKRIPTVPTVSEFIAIKSKRFMEDFSWDHLMEYVQKQTE